MPNHELETVDLDESLAEQLRSALARLESERELGPTVTIDTDLLRAMLKAGN